VSSTAGDVMAGLSERLEEPLEEPPSTCEVVLRGVFIPHFEETSQYHDELMRELRMIVANPTGNARLNELADMLLREFHDYAPTIREAVWEVEDRGLDFVELRLRVSLDSRQWLVQFRDHFREMDAFSQSGMLLVLGSPGVAVVFREWILGELIDQIDGKEPQPYR
jgi:hypothetical protein